MRVGWTPRRTAAHDHGEESAGQRAPGPVVTGFSLRAGAAALLAATLLASGSAGSETTVGRFSAGDLAGWKEREFKGRSRYEIAHDPDGTGRVLAAASESAASALYLERRIDLAETPWLAWRWKVEAPLPIADERSKRGDDFAARVYVVSRGFGLLRRPLAITYVWASAPVGSSWPNPFTSRAVMVVVDSGPGGEWRHHERNVRADFRRYHGKDVKRLDGVAVMTDTDNSDTQGRAWYGDLSFRAARGAASGRPGAD